MSDNYQAVYDAVRSRFHGCDVGDAVSRALQDAFGMANHHMACVAENYSYAAAQLTRPSIMLRLVPFKDGDQWCVLFGDDLQSGIAGFGDTPHKASQAFDKNYGWVG